MLVILVTITYYIKRSRRKFIVVLNIVHISLSEIYLSRSKKVDLVFSLFSFLFYFLFKLFFHFSIFRTLGLGLEVISHISHS